MVKRPSTPVDEQPTQSTGTRERGVNLAGIRILFELEERLGARILEALYAEGTGQAEGIRPPKSERAPASTSTQPLDRSTADR